MDRLELFERALVCCQGLGRIVPRDTQSRLADQIRYLINVERGLEEDQTLLKNVGIGLIAAREIDFFDRNAAQLFFKVQDEADAMASSLRQG